MALAPNLGHLPDECILARDDEGKPAVFARVRVVLFNGYDTKVKEPAGWASGGRGGCSWKISRRPHPYEIKEYEKL